MADESIWKVVKELKKRVRALEEAHNETVIRYDDNFKIIEEGVNHNAQVVDAQINSLKSVVAEAKFNSINAKFGKVWLAIGFGSVAIFMLCRKLQKIEDRIDTIEEDKDKR